MGVEIPATFATTTYISLELNRRYKLNITYEPKRWVGVVNPAIFATTTYISHKRNKVYTNYHT